MAPGIFEAIGNTLGNVRDAILNSTAPDDSMQEDTNAPAAKIQPSSSTTPCKRTASPPSSTNLAYQKRPKTSSTFSEEERRLVQGSYRSSTDSEPIPIPMPQDPWSVLPSPRSEMPNRKKPAAAPYRPQNTLHKSTPGATSIAGKPKKRGYGNPSNTPNKFQQLPTETRTGDNVLPQQQVGHFPEEPANKKLKLSNSIKSPLKDDSERAAEVSAIRKPDEWFDRKAISQDATRPPARKGSVIIIDSQDSAPHSSHINDFFNSNRELRDTDNMLNPKPHKSRKPYQKSASSSQNDHESVNSLPQSSRLHKNEPNTDHAIQDDGLVEFLNCQPAARQRAGYVERGGRFPTRITKSSPVRPTPRPKGAVQVVSDFNTRLGRQQMLQTRVMKKGPLPSRSNTIADPRSRPRASSDASPRLGHTFIRDTAPAQTPKTGLRQNMLTDSSQKRALVVDDGSEDELALDTWANKRVLPSQARHKRTSQPKATEKRRSPSPSDIELTPFTDSRRAGKPPREVVEESESESDDERREVIYLKSLNMVSETLKDERLGLLYLSDDNAFAVQSNGAFLCDKFQQPWKLKSHHAQSLTYSPEGKSLKMILCGARDSRTCGRICLEFYGPGGLRLCLERIMIINDQVIVKRISDNAVEKVYLNALDVIASETKKARDPELLAMQNRQKLSASNGQDITAPSTATNVTRGNAMQRQFAHQTESSPPSAQISQHFTTTRSTRRVQDKDITPEKESEPERWTKVHGLPQWDSPLIYPATGPRRTTIEAQDVERLDDGEFLNDNLISFALRHLEETNSQLKGKVHIFNTFFYTSLSTTKAGKKGFNYDAVKRWTKDINIFSVPYIVVPVNLNFHWFVAIICNLDKWEKKMNEIESDEDDDEEEMLDNEIGTTAGDDNGQTELRIIDLGSEEENDGSRRLSQGVEKMSITSYDKEERLEVRPDDNNSDIFEFNTKDTQESGTTTDDLPELSKLKPVSTLRKGKKKVHAPVRKFAHNAPTIITLDSLGGTHYAEARNLKDYVVAEALEKQGMDISREEIQGVLAKDIPIQNNFCDCGVYLVGYINQFLKAPGEFVRKTLSRELDGNKDFPGFNASDMRTALRDQLLGLADEQKTTKRLKRKEALQAKQAAQRQLDERAEAHPPSSANEIAG